MEKFTTLAELTREAGIPASRIIAAVEAGLVTPAGRAGRHPNSPIIFLSADVASIIETLKATGRMKASQGGGTMIASDFLASAKAAITEGENQLAAEYLDLAKTGIQATRHEAVRALAKAAIDDLERIQNAERLCRYAMTTGQATPAAIAFIRELEAAPRLDKKKSLFSAQNAAAFDWHRRNRSEIFDLITLAAEESTTARQL